MFDYKLDTSLWFPSPCPNQNTDLKYGDILHFLVLHQVLICIDLGVVTLSTIFSHNF